MLKKVARILPIIPILIFANFVQDVEATRSATPLAPDNDLEGGLVYVDTRSSDQAQPAVAYSTLHGQYLVVYESSENSGSIYGRFIEAETGFEYGPPFQISSDIYNSESSPDVVYSPNDDRFIVVYEQHNGDTTYDIIATVVYGEYKSDGVQQPPGADQITINTTYDYNFNPVIAYNSDNDQMMVVYMSNVSGKVEKIRGRMMNLKSNGYQFDLFGTTDFIVWEATEDTKGDPDIAWGGESDTFLVAWEQAGATSNTKKIIIRYFKDTYQSGSEQGVDGSSHAISTPTSTGLDTHDNAAVAYDPNQDMYGVVYRTKAEDINNLYKISGVFVKGHVLSPDNPGVTDGYVDIQPLVSSPADNNLNVDISFSGVGFQVCYSQLFPIFYDDYHYILQRDFTYYNNSAHVSGILVVRTSDPNKQLLQSSLAGAGQGHGLVVWRHEYSDTDRDIHGQRIKSLPPAKIMLPAIFR